MSLRETLNKNQTAVIIGSIAIVVLAIGAAIFLGGGRSTAQANANPKAFYSSDDGKSFFLDDDLPTKVAPIQTSDGKTAYRCEVWSCDGGKTKQVVFLQKWTESARKRVADVIAQDKRDDPLFIQIVEGGAGSLVKLPNTADDPKNWVPIADPRSAKIMAPNCPSGSAVERINPNE